ncbi:MAG TPA: SpoIVB peptidase S55 domain-containing protein [Terriglobia bacterium]|nr:SpoIVB peptidase S55 domain-containing protein [Terriglobia bacterium]
MKTKTLRIFAFALAAFLTITPHLAAQNTKFMAVDEVRQGMKGFGKTVFQGTTIEQFDVEVLGVLKNFAPRQDMILARLSGGPLEKTGVIAGMSGSPVYIDGKLIGAVAFAFPFAKEPIAGIQPIQQMLGILDQKPGNTQKIAQASSGILPSESPTAFVFGQLQKLADGTPLHQLLLPQSLLSVSPFQAGAAPSLMHIQTPLLVSGASQVALQQFAPFFNAFGFTPVQAGGGASAASLRAAGPSKLEPGSSVNVEMIRGDLSWSANGTVTYVDGDKVYAFGHPNLSAGPTNVPMSSGYVISLLPNIQNSFKLAVPLDVVGSFQQDRSTGIAGTLGATSKMIPVSVKLTSSMNTVNQYNFEVASDRFLTPPLMNFIVFNAITASERTLGEMTLSISGQIHVKNHDPINIGNVFSSDMNGPVMASIAAVTPIQYLLMSGYDGVVIDKIDLEITSTDRKTNAQLERISVDKNEVHPGETITMTSYLRASDGALIVERNPVQIPSGLPAGSVQLLVGDGSTVTTSELRRGPATVPTDVKQVIKELNKLRKNDRLYIKILSSEPGVVIGGQELPSLPPSMAAVINTDRSSTRSVSGTASSTVREYELPQSKYVIQGQRSLNLTVKP